MQSNMKNNNLPNIYLFLFLMGIFAQNIYAAEETSIPDVNGDWVNIGEDDNKTTAIITLSQDGKYLGGIFKDSKDGEIIIEAPLQGYIDAKGNVIFDISFGRITSTNRLKLSPDKNSLDGTFSNTAGNQGEVHLHRH